MTDTSQPGPSRYDLTWSQYGKAEVRMVHVDRSTPRHVIRDLNVSSALRGDFDAAYTDGDNTGILTTDAQKNTVFGLARETGVGEPEEFALALVRQLLSACPSAQGALVTVEEYPWARLPVAGDAGHDHAFSRAGSHVRTVLLDATRDGAVSLTGGLKDLVVLKSTGSEYKGYLQERFTTLAETDDRILATQVTASWHYTDDAAAGGADFAAVSDGVLAAMLATFADLHSLALQQTLHAMASAALDARPEIDAVTLTLPNKHHFLQDLSAFGLDNPKAVYHADDRPYGLIEGTVTRR